MADYKELADLAVKAVELREASYLPSNLEGHAGVYTKSWMEVAQELGRDPSEVLILHCALYTDWFDIWEWQKIANHQHEQASVENFK